MPRSYGPHTRHSMPARVYRGSNRRVEQLSPFADIPRLLLIVGVALADAWLLRGPDVSGALSHPDPSSNLKASSGTLQVRGTSSRGTTNPLRQNITFSRGDVYGQMSTGGRRPDAVAHGVVGVRSKFDGQWSRGKCTGRRDRERRSDDAGVAAARGSSDAEHAEHAEYARGCRAHGHGRGGWRVHVCERCGG